jgi:hypothetical protein
VRGAWHARDCDAVQQEPGTELHASGSCQPSQKHSDTSSECCGESAGSDDEAQQREDIPEADLHSCHTRVTASDWRTVAYFDD